MYLPLTLCVLYLLPVYCHWHHHHHHRHDPNPFHNNHNYYYHHHHDPNPFHNNRNFHHHHHFHHHPYFHHTSEYHRDHGFKYPSQSQPPTPVATVTSIPFEVSSLIPPQPSTVTPLTTTQPQLDPFDQLFCDVFDLYQDLRQYCHNTTHEVANGSNYRITATLQGYQENSIVVKVKHRILSITATSTNGAKYEELIIIPTVAVNQSLSWKYDGEELTIFFSKPTELNTCFMNISASTITVPKV
ncbi:hypothetical protein ABMA28_006686 [Loxostege sticticalis]|uniref:Uncharacterized protein n=1 Tax=Loxostege sticticalis TaxID=481309 RepID=A0ABD0TN78_LOXSC